jgi:hypothetical protein
MTQLFLQAPRGKELESDLLEGSNLGHGATPGERNIAPHLGLCILFDNSHSLCLRHYTVGYK